MISIVIKTLIRTMSRSIRVHFVLTGLLISAFLFTQSAFSTNIEFHKFDNKQQEHLYHQLISELRCVKCQNQNLAESNAELATDLREKTYEMVVKGKNREDVVNYMTARYGDFVLYKPPFKTETLLLWIGPPILLLISLIILFRRIRAQKQTSNSLSDTERADMRELLNNKKPEA